MSDGTEGVELSDGRSGVILHRPRHVADDGFEHRVELHAGPFQGSIKAYAYANSYGHFCEQLIELYETLKGEARLNGYENLQLSLAGDGLGHIHANVSAVADHHFGIQLKFQMSLDQTQIPKFVDSIKQTFVHRTS